MSAFTKQPPKKPSILPGNHYLHTVIHVKLSGVATGAVVWSRVGLWHFKWTKFSILPQEISSSLLPAGWWCLPEPLNVATRKDQTMPWARESQQEIHTQILKYLNHNIYSKSLLSKMHSSDYTEFM